MMAQLILAVICLVQAGTPVTWPSGDAGVPTLFIIGDSTVKNRLPLVGWGDPIRDFFDLNRIHVENDAIAGRSSRTFVTEGRWEAVRGKLRKGDFVLMQFGHNDTKAAISADRYSLPGLGEETEDAVDAKTKKAIQIHTFGWYMRKMIGEAETRGLRRSCFRRCLGVNGRRGRLCAGRRGLGGGRRMWRRRRGRRLSI